jgi:hypothetical protein
MPSGRHLKLQSSQIGTNFGKSGENIWKMLEVERHFEDQLL